MCSSGQTKTNSFASGLTSDALTTIPETLVMLPIVSALICLKLLSSGKFAILTRTSSLIFSAYSGNLVCNASLIALANASNILSGFSEKIISISGSVTRSL